MKTQKTDKKEVLALESTVVVSASIGTSGTCQRLLAARILHAGSKNTARWQQDFYLLAARKIDFQGEIMEGQLYRNGIG